MKQIVYVDVLVLENFFMNYLLLYIVNRFCRCNAKIWRIILAATIGALYVVIIFFPELHVFYSLIAKIIVSVIMIIVAFLPYCLRDFLKEFILFYIEAFIIGGCILGIFYLKNYNMGFDNGVFFMEVTPEYIICGSFISLIMVKFGFDYFDDFFSKEKNKVFLHIVMNKKECDIKALVDTGNSLKDPLTCTPVIIVYYKSIINILPEEIKRLITIEECYENLTREILNSSLKQRIRIIPYRALGVNNGILLGIKVDFIISRFRFKKSYIEKPVIALSNQPISNEDDYQALAYPEILRGVYK